MTATFAALPDLPGELARLLAQVPAGRVTTYGALAEALGNRIATRWVGNYMLHHAHDDACTCHRVVRVDGSLGLYIAGPASAKAARLRAEGVEVRAGAIDLARFGWREFVGGRPLERLRQLQDEVTARVSLRGSRRLPALVSGVDVSYRTNGVGVGAYVLVDAATGELCWSTTVVVPVAFPYVTTYLTFRELPVLLALVAEARRAGMLHEPVLVDGSGVLHPRHAGVASHFGVVGELATIGVTKKLLHGQVQLDGLEPLESREVLEDGRPLGVAIRPTAGSRRPIFVSPGHRVSLATAELVVRRVLRGRRLPEPIYWADRLSRAVARSGGTP